MKLSTIKEDQTFEISLVYLLNLQLRRNLGASHDLKGEGLCPMMRVCLQINFSFLRQLCKLLQLLFFEISVIRIHTYIVYS